MEIPESTPLASKDALLAICLLAAFSDGRKSAEEREEIRRIGEEIGSSEVGALSRQILLGKLSLAQAVQSLSKKEERLLAYEMALGICENEGPLTVEEEKFLSDLRSQLALDAADCAPVESELALMTTTPATPPAPSSPAVDNSGTILKYSILNGALELLPETLATVAIIPLQMKLVYGIGRSHGVELDRTHLKEFLATAGMGMGSQVIEGFARKLFRNLGRKAGGKVAGRIADQLTGSAFSFASTYAIGHLAERYYAGGRTLNSQSVKELFSSLQARGRELHETHLPQIREKAQSLTPSSILSLVRGGEPV